VRFEKFFNGLCDLRRQRRAEDGRSHFIQLLKRTGFRRGLRRKVREALLALGKLRVGHEAGVCFGRQTPPGGTGKP